ncbi:MAG: hypothetical protein R2787_11110 [Saprospiraceae bacterium]
MPHHGFKFLVLITLIGIVGCQKIDPVLEPTDAGGHLQASLRDGDTLSVMAQLLTGAANYSGTVIEGNDLVSVLDPQWEERFYLNDSVILVPCTSLQRFIPFSWAYLYYTVDSTMGVYYYELVPDRDFAFSFETTEEFVEDFTGWGAVYVIGEGIIDASHYELGLIDTIYVDESLLAANIRGGDNNWWNTRWDEWSVMFTDGGDAYDGYQFVTEDGRFFYFPICKICSDHGDGACNMQNCPKCSSNWQLILEGDGGNEPNIYSNNNGNNSGGIYNSGGSSSGANGIFSNIPSDFIDNWKQLDRECRNNIEAIQAIVGALSPEAWECLGQSCGVQEGANGAESGGAPNSMTDDVLDVLLHELDGAALVDPCNPNKPHQALMSELIVSLCGGEYMGREDVFKSLENLDVLIGDPSLNNCPLAKCLFRKLNNSSNTLYCSTIGNFIGNDKFTLTIKINYNPGAIDKTNYNPSTKGITITLAGDGCSGDALNMASNILHEAVHAELFRKALALNQNPLDPVTYEEMWNEALKLNFPNFEAPYTTSHHEIMAKYYVDKIANSLRILDGNRFPIDNYKYLAWEGLSVHGSYLGFVSLYMSEYYDDHLQLIAQPSSICD